MTHPSRTGQSPAWHWQQHTSPGWPTWRATVPGPVGDDGGTAYIGHRDTLAARCTTCGRHALLWQASLALLRPFPPALDLPGGGCTRGHTAAAIPTNWAAISAAYARAADAWRDLPPDRWSQALLRMRDRQAAWARWLDGQPAPARRLALILWTRDHSLNITDTATIVAAALSDPPRS